jgi:hypothetical protein
MENLTCDICGKGGGIILDNPRLIYLHSILEFPRPGLFYYTGNTYAITRARYATCPPCWDHFCEPARHPSNVRHVGNIPSKF